MTNVLRALSVVFVLVFGFAVSYAAEHGDPLADHVLGEDDAPITIVEYASFTCPHCARFHTDVYPDLKANFIETGKVRFILREVYFDKYGLWAGMLARCGGPDRYYGIADLLLNKQSEWARGDDATIAQNLYRIGRQAGLEDATMQACLQDNDMARKLVADYQEKAGADDVSATPTFIVDGEKMSNMSYSEFEAVLNDRLGN